MLRRWLGHLRRPARPGIAPAAHPDDEVVTAGEYELRVTVLHRGTRSEGRIGTLHRDGVRVTSREPIDAGTVRFVFLGDERPHLWSVSGWAVDASDAGDDSDDVRTPRRP